MVFKFKHKLVVSAILASLSLQTIAFEDVSVLKESELLVSRYIIQYKKTDLPMTSKANKTTFDLSNIKKVLNSKGIQIKRELAQHASVSVELTSAMLQSLENDPSIESINIDPQRKFLALYEDTVGDPNTMQLTPYAIAQSQADQLVLQAGQKVCVIDSGIAGSDGETGGLNNDFVWGNITGVNDSGTGNWNADGGPHGTHVAGTVGAADNGFGVVGMAPGVPMHIIKVFNDDGWGYSSDLAFAAEKCTDAGATIITMSLGGGGASSIEENAFNTFTENGGLVLAAAGNDGNDTRSYPAGYDSVMMIGANDGDNNIASFSQFPSCNAEQTNCVEAAAGGVNTLSTYPSGGATVAGLSADDVGYGSTAMENTGSVAATTFFMGIAEETNVAADGNICMIDRGTVTFQVKVKNCEDSGGVGAVIINNVSGLFTGTLGDPNETSIPVVGAALEDRDALLAATNVSISVGAGDYGLMSGTSMATPGVAGVAALVWSNHPACSGTDIRNALKLSAEDAGTAGHDVYFGNGIVKAKAASDYINANGCGGSLPLAGKIQLAADSYSISEDGGSVEITINRINGTFGEVSFNLATSDITALATNDYVGLSQSLIMLDGETSKTVSITISDDSDYEGDETFSLTISNPSGNTEILEPNVATISILENDPMPPAGDFILSSSDYSADENGGSLVVTINRVDGSYGEASVEISTSDDTALSGIDYESFSQTITFNDGEMTKNVTIVMLDDSVYEGDESFNVTLTNPSERSNITTPSSAVLTIVEDDPEPPAGELNWSQTTLTLDEIAGSFVATINRANGSFGECRVTASVSHATTNAADLVSDAAVEVVFAAGETTKTVSFAIIDDAVNESDESFSLVLSTLPKCSLGANKTLTVNITDNDDSGGGSISLWLLSLLVLARRSVVKK